MALKLMYITNQPRIARIVEVAGVDWVFVDMETLGKAARQGHLDSVKSHHTVEDVRAVKAALQRAELLVRVNPINDGSAEEIERVIAAGADIIMLPMWKSVEDAARFLNMVNGRCQTILLLETMEAEKCLDEVLKLPLLDKIHIGLNDLHLSYGKSFMFEMLADGTVERICRKLKEVGVTYGFGGIGRIGEGMLPAEHILGEHVRLGSQMVILSRSFCNVEKEASEDCIKDAFETGVAVLREHEIAYREKSCDALEENRVMLCREVAQIVATIKGVSV